MAVFLGYATDAKSYQYCDRHGIINYVFLIFIMLIGLHYFSNTLVLYNLKSRDVGSPDGVTVMVSDLRSRIVGPTPDRDAIK